MGSTGRGSCARPTPTAHSAECRPTQPVCPDECCACRKDGCIHEHWVLSLPPKTPSLPQQHSRYRLHRLMTVASPVQMMSGQLSLLTSAAAARAHCFAVANNLQCLQPHT